MRRTPDDAKKAEYNGNKKDHTVDNLMLYSDNQRIFF